VGAGVIALGLTAVSYFVWTSPTGPVAQVQHIVSAAQGVDMKNERNELLGNVVQLKSTVSENQAQIDSLEQQLEQAKVKLAQAEETIASSKVPTSTPPAKKPTAPAPAAPTDPVAATPAETVSAPSKAELVDPASRYFGLYTAQAPFNWATYDDVSSKLGNRPSMVGYFGGWDETFRPDAVTRAWQRNTMPMLTWESRPIDSPNSQVDEPDYTMPKILGDPDTGTPGAYDDYIRQYARDIVSTGLPLAIRFDHEMNGIWYPWAEDNGHGDSINGNRTGDYVKMWQHVHDIFQQEGANDLVIWVWAPNIINNLPSAHKSLEYLQSLYPGDEYVDWVGLSGYLRPTYKPENNFTFDYSFGSSLDQLRQITDKPILLAEIGASEIGGHKAAWLTDVFDALARPENDDIIGLSWFNLAVTSYVEGELATNDWRIDSRPESLQAFSDGISDPADRFALTPYE
jgi:hypothetical protein